MTLRRPLISRSTHAMKESSHAQAYVRERADGIEHGLCIDKAKLRRNLKISVV
jgi:hypothetical protein